MLTIKRPNDPVMVLNIMDTDMEVRMASMFFFSDVGAALQSQLNSNLDHFLADPGLAVMYLLHPASDEQILKYEEQLEKPIGAFSDRLEEMKRGAN